MFHSAATTMMVAALTFQPSAAKDAGGIPKLQREGSATFETVCRSTLWMLVHIV